ncbi:tetratricopeptide repeat protein [Crocosphaera sp. UHCC 0190]|uniref:tetratricopeptide repeat protein n=1 Tax=Crocosphaera sp. UHCC 0190 TaxID=3110246 RepID=UPI002B20159C|nr:tetratricopeptide repeat protein [Crocosphaera sp. UHCC 0190]MEA5510062.1 tetratricopeptide repeat protein [Crocosphaera sp. UHCC 0190]
MKISKTKHRRWIYTALVLMLLALISFSILPLVSSIVQASQPQGENLSLAATESAKLENEALGYQLVLEREPDNDNALRGLLEARLRQGDLAAALIPLERLAQLNPQQPQYGLLLAQGKQQLQDYEGATATYREILAANPGEIAALKGMVDVLIAQNRSQQAISLVQNTLNQALKEGSEESQSESPFNLTSLQLLLGEIYTKQKRYDEALAIYDQAIKGDVDDFRPLLAKAIMLRQQGKETEAQTLFKDAILKAPVQYKEQLKDIALESQKSANKTDNSVTETEEETK